MNNIQQHVQHQQNLRQFLATLLERKAGLEKTLGYYQGYSWNDQHARELCKQLDNVDRLIADVQNELAGL